MPLVEKLCMCNYGEKEPASRGKASMLGKPIGKEFYCKHCGLLLSQADVDLFGYELGLKD